MTWRNNTDQFIKDSMTHYSTFDANHLKPIQPHIG